MAAPNNIAQHCGGLEPDTSWQRIPSAIKECEFKTDALVQMKKDRRRKRIQRRLEHVIRKKQHRKTIELREENTDQLREEVRQNTEKIRQLQEEIIKRELRIREEEEDKKVQLLGIEEIRIQEDNERKIFREQEAEGDREMRQLEEDLERVLDELDGPDAEAVSIGGCGARGVATAESATSHPDVGLRFVAAETLGGEHQPAAQITQYPRVPGSGYSRKRKSRVDEDNDGSAGASPCPPVLRQSLPPRTNPFPGIRPARRPNTQG